MCGTVLYPQVRVREESRRWLPASQCRPAPRRPFQGRAGEHRPKQSLWPPQSDRAAAACLSVPGRFAAAAGFAAASPQ